jgi:hypothetical protein
VLHEKCGYEYSVTVVMGLDNKPENDLLEFGIKEIAFNAREK